MNYSINELKSIADQIRGRVIEMSHRAKAAHLGSSLSCVDILVAAYWSVLSIDPANFSDPNRDRFILSKGHAASALFAVLAFRGFFPQARLDSFAVAGSGLEEHPGPACVPGVEVATGSLGHGLSVGIGMALAGRIQKKSYRIFVLLSDGECNEGSIWEAAMFAAGQKLDNLLVVIDFNKWQATGRSCQIMALQPLKDKWQSFGWSVSEVDGHNIEVLSKTLSNLPDGSDRPVAVIANTVKGKGVSFMEDNNDWHYRIPNAQELENAKKELGLL